MTNGPRRVVLNTSASSGIGWATAELVATRGKRVFGGVRAVATPHPLAGAELVPLDVRDETSVKACVEEVRNRAGRIDVLINNASINLVGAIEETSISQAQALFDTNVIGVLRVNQAVLPGMRRQGTGLIVNISSILGFIPAPFMGVYASTKAEGRIDAYASQRHRTAGVMTQNTNTAPEPKLVAEQVLRSIEGPYPHATAHGQAALLSWLRRLLPARLFEPSLRKAFALDSASKGGGATEPRS